MDLIAGIRYGLKSQVPRIYHMHEAQHHPIHSNVCNFKETLSHCREREYFSYIGNPGFCAKSTPLGMSPWTNMGMVVLIASSEGMPLIWVHSVVSALPVEASFK